MREAALRLVSVYRVPGHEEALYRLLRERPSRMNISHRKMPSFPEHRRFVRSRPYKEWNFICVGGRTAGCLYLSRLNEIGIFLFAGFRRRGLEKKALRHFIARRRRLRLLANVSPRNPFYARLFRQLGFRHVQNSYCLEPASGGRSR